MGLNNKKVPVIANWDFKIKPGSVLKPKALRRTKSGVSHTFRWDLRKEKAGS